MARFRVEFDNRLLSRINGCLAGVAVGDALGMPMAGWTPIEVRRRYGTVRGLIAPVSDHLLHGKLLLGSITDDTQLTMAIVDMILTDDRRAQRDVATLANAVGAIKVGKKATGRNVPTLEEVRGFLEERGLGIAVRLD